MKITHICCSAMLLRPAECLTKLLFLTGSYESGIRSGYKHIYFNITHQMFKIWALSTVVAICFYEMIKYLTRVSEVLMRLQNKAGLNPGLTRSNKSNKDLTKCRILNLSNLKLSKAIRTVLTVVTTRTP